MKFQFRNGIIAILVLSILLSPAITWAGEVRIEQLVQFLAIGTGTMTGTYFPLGKAFASIWSAGSDRLKVASQASNGSIENIRLMKSGDLNLAIAQSDIVLAALKGTGSFENDAWPDLKVLMALFPEVVQIIASENSGITSISQLKNRKIAVGSKGSGSAITSIELLANAGIAPSDYEPVFYSYDEAIQGMERGDCDAMIVIAGIPTKAVVELEKRIKITIVSFYPEEIAALTSTLPYLSAVSIPAGTYSTQTEKTETLALMALLVGSARLSDNLVYQLNGMIFDNLDYLQKVHERARDISLQTYMNSVPENTLHPGSLRFYQDRKQQ
ncbi:MAG: TAXI family TRAP transporter solute-binding subunit [Candidatus Riflebacteria bacterium]